jgi:hypothetical protein
VVSNCERRINERTHEFNGILDQVNEEKTSNKKKAVTDEDEDIDIDKVW